MQTGLINFKTVWKNFINLGVFQVAGMLLQLIIIPIISTGYGLAVFGQVALSASIAVILGNLVNYSTNQTSVKEISLAGLDQNKLSLILSEVLFLRLVVFLILTVVVISGILIVFSFSALSFGLDAGTLFLLFLSILPFVLADVISPLFLLNGIEKIHWISWGSLLPRVASFLLIFFIPLNKFITPLLNIFLTLPLLLFYIILGLFLFRRLSLKITQPSVWRIKKLLFDNFFVVFNGSSVYLQQTIFMITVAGTASQQVLGAYGIIDKLLGAIRQIISSFSLSVFPGAARLFQESRPLWLKYRSIIQYGYATVFLIAGIVIYFFASEFSLLFAGFYDDTTILFFRLFSVAPLLMALNANNVLDLLLTKSYPQLFQISILILFFTFVTCSCLSILFDDSALGLYPLIMESICLILYSIFPRNNSAHAIK